MRGFAFETVDVFTDRRFGGNPLAVFPDAAGLSDTEMQAIAREFNLSETSFVLPPSDPQHTARVRIFTPGGELPFAGHPNVGTGWLLGRLGRATDGVLLFEELAGLVRVEADATGATIAAPQPLTTGAELPHEVVAACVGLPPDALVGPAPVLAGVGTAFVVAEVAPDALARATPDTAAFRAAVAAFPVLQNRLGVLLHVGTGPAVRTRMFAPLAGIPEDPATGSANAALAALLLSRGDAPDGAWTITQGVEMGRPSLLHATARRAEDGIRAGIGGGCVAVMHGVLSL
jgi:trans-2,3-dihydro-3-hydroxyanthranilate isomerase